MAKYIYNGEKFVNIGDTLDLYVPLEELKNNNI